MQKKLNRAANQKKVHVLQNLEQAWKVDTGQVKTLVSDQNKTFISTLKTITPLMNQWLLIGI